MTQQSNTPSDQERVYDALLALAPATMREMFAPMVQIALAQLAPETVSSLANDLQNAFDENGNPDLAKLVAVGKRFGLTDEMISGYQMAAQAG